MDTVYFILALVAVLMLYKIAKDLGSIWFYTRILKSDKHQNSSLPEEINGTEK